MKRLVSLLVVSVLLSGCAPETERPVAPATGTFSPLAKIQQVDDTSNILSIINGAVVVSRTGENDLTTTPVQAIDSENGTFWMSPPDDMPQSATIALPTAFEISEVGFNHGVLLTRNVAPAQVSFESSTDGTTFNPLAVAKAKDLTRGYLLEVAPTQATHLRVTVNATIGGAKTFQLAALEARGRRSGEEAPFAIQGSWTINQFQAVFAERDGRVYGAIGEEPTMAVDGGRDGAIVRFSWTRSAEWGFGLLTVDPNSSKMNLLWWHESVIPLFSAPVFWGTRSGGSSALNREPKVMETFLERMGKYRLYEISAEGDTEAFARTLDSVMRSNPERKWRIVAHEHREATAEANAARSTAALERLRLQLAQSGVDLKRIEFRAAGATESKDVESTLQKRMASRFDLEIVGHPSLAE